MTYQEVNGMIEAMGLPCAYYEFPNNTELEPPFICFWYPESDDLMADNQNYVGIRRLYVELYTDEKRFDLEQSVETALSANNLTYRKTETYITGERMYQITYETEVIING